MKNGHNTELNDQASVDSTSSSVRNIIRNTNYNESEIVRAPDDYLDLLERGFTDKLETIHCTSEAPWDGAGENLLRRWMDEAKDNSILHKKTAYKLKHFNRITSICVIFSTALVFLVTSLFPCTNDETYKIIQVIISFISLIIANIASFFDFGPKYQAHFQYEGLWMRFAIDIEELLVTDVDFRPPKDRTIVEYREKMGNLVTTAPEV